MKVQAVSNILFLLFIFIYHMYGDYENNMWSVAFYFILSLYILILNIGYYHMEIIKFNKDIFLIVTIYFLLYFITEGLCFIYPGAFKSLVTNINMYAAITLFIILFGILIYKYMKQ